MENKIKISLVVSDLSEGGMLRALLLYDVVSKLDYDAEIVGLQSRKEVYVPLSTKVPLVSVKKYKFPFFFWSALKIMKKLNGDIIYAIKPKLSSFGIALLKNRKNKKPLILDMDDWELSWYEDSFWKKVYSLRNPDGYYTTKWLEKLVHKADAITADTSFLLKRFGGIYLPNACDTNLFDPKKYSPDKIRAHYGLKGLRILLFSGAPRPHKGLEDILRALDRINEPDLRLVIIGDNPYDGYHKRLFKKWSHRIIKLPRQPHHVMPEIMSAAHIVVVPQRDNFISRAQFPLKLAEGMAMAKPILTSRVGDIPKIIGNFGYIVEPNNPEQLAKAIKHIFTNYAKAKSKAKKARKKCIKYYSTEAIADILFPLVNNLVRPKENTQSINKK